jgi:DNA-binding GntR family transcriptional regulator
MVMEPERKERTQVIFNRQEVEEKISGPEAISHAEKTVSRQILEGFYFPGEKISDSAISDELGISRTSVRESFQRLVKDGLLTIMPNRGAFVAQPSDKEIIELFEIRMALEVYAVGLATQRAPIEKILSLKEMLSITKMSMVEHGGRYPIEQDFHATVCAMAGNQLLTDEIERIHHRIKLIRLKSGYKPARAKVAYFEHLAILEAMLARDVVRAQKAMVTHLENSQDSSQDLTVQNPTEQTLLSR